MKIPLPPPSADSEYLLAQQVSRAYETSGTAGVRFKVDDLGTRSIAGLVARGMRITRTGPAGEAENPLLLTDVEERWTSDRFRVILLDIKTVPGLPRTTYQVTDFTTGEPDASVFKPPADYTTTQKPVSR